MKSWLSRYFIPSQHNDFKPHILQKVAVMVMSVLVAFTFAFSNLYAIMWQASDWLVATVLPAVIVDLTNEERDTYGETTLVRNSTLDEAARLKAQHMARYGYFAHYAPDGTSPWHWFNEVDYAYAHAGENLAIHFSESEDVIEAWMNSPTHKQNIVDSKFTEIGVGTARGTYNGFETVYVVQLFGTPRKANVAPVAVAGVATTDEPASKPVEIALADTTPSEPEPEPVAAEPEPEPETEPIETVVVTELKPEPTPVFEPVAEPAEPVATPTTRESSLITTSTGAAAAGINPTRVDDSQSARTLDRMLTSPSIILEVVYLILASFVLVALVLSVLVEIRRQHPVQVAYGFLLLFAMGGLYYAHVALTDGVIIV